MPLPRTSRAVSTWVPIVLVLCPMVAVGQQASQSFREVDFFYAQQPQLFRELWLAAQTKTVRVAVLGDSQETTPTSRGFQYVPLLNYEMWKRFGNSPETPLAGCFDYGTTPPANWLLAGRCTTPGPAATRVSSARLLPNVRPAAFSTLNSTANITGGTHGQLTMLQQDAIDVHFSAGIPSSNSYFNTAGVVKARIFAATNVSSGEVAYQARPSEEHTPSYSAAVTTTGTLDLGLQSATFAVKAADTTVLNFDGKRYMTLEVFGTSDAALTDIIGLRFFNESHPQGVVIDSFSRGGYTASTLLTGFADVGTLFDALGFHAGIIHYGANEAGSVTADQFRSNLSDVISRVRTWAGDASFPIILIADVYQGGLSLERAAEYDRYVGAQLEIAQADANIMVINARRLMDNIGWNATSGLSSQFLSDELHYTGLGAQVLAAAVVSALMGEIHVSGCARDPGAVSLQSSMTLIVDLGGTSACANHGQLSVARALTLNQPALEVVLTQGFVPAVEQRFKLLSFATVSGAFASVTLPVLPAGLSWNTDELYTTGTIRVVATPTTPPGTAPLVTNVTSASGAESGSGGLVAPPTTPPGTAPLVTNVTSGSGAESGSAHSNDGKGGGGSLELVWLLCLALSVPLVRNSGVLRKLKRNSLEGAPWASFRGGARSVS